MFTQVSHLTNMVLLISWPQQLKLLILRWKLSSTVESEALVSDDEGMDEEGLSGF